MIVLTQALFATSLVIKAVNSYSEPQGTEVPPLTAVCADGWTHSNVTGRCYKFVKDVSFLQAMRQCQELGAKLVSIHGAEENKWLADFVRPQCTIGSFFIGLVRSEEDDSWGWIDLSESNYTNWYPGEPNNTGGDEDCVVAWTEDFNERPSNLWNDIQCYSVRGAVCMKNGN